jgi:hypothetical protein
MVAAATATPPRRLNMERNMKCLLMIVDGGRRSRRHDAVPLETLRMALYGTEVTATSPFGTARMNFS